MIIDEEVYLEHFGVKGMKWGVITDLKAARVNRAKKNDAKAAGYQKQIDTINAKRSRFGTKRRRKNQIEELTEDRDEQLADAKARRAGKMTSGQRKAAIGLGVAGAVIAAYGTYKVQDSGEFNRLALKGKDLLDGKKTHTWKQDSNLAASNMDVSKLQSLVVDKINPNFGEPGTKMNCRRATFAYEMRRRGHDVAATKSRAATGQTAGGLLRATSKEDLDVPTSTFFSARRIMAESLDKITGRNRDVRLTDVVKKGGTWGKNKIDMADEVSAQESIFKALAKQPNGSRGELGVGYFMGGGHSVAWEVVKGKPVIVDGQSGKIYKTLEEFEATDWIINDAGFTRLDNAELNNDFLMRWLKDA